MWYGDMGDVRNQLLDCNIGKVLIPGSDVAEKHPEADVKGIDVAAIQPSWVPPNARFELDDFNTSWVDENKYDLVHQRELLGSVTDWTKFYERAFRYICMLQVKILV